MGKYALVKPTEKLVEQYNDIWRGKKSDGEQLSEGDYRIQIFEDICVDIRDYLPKEIKTLSKDDKKIQYYLEKKDVANLFSEINRIYHTWLKPEEIERIAEGWSLSDTTKTVDDLVMHSQKKAGKYAYSFATKVFNFIDPDTYPIMDKYVVNMLKAYNIKGISNWGDYQKYIEAYDEFKKRYSLDKFSYKRIDEFLWTYGKLIQRYWKKEGVLLFDSTVWFEPKIK